MSQERNWTTTSPLVERNQLRICQLRAVGNDRSPGVISGLPVAKAFHFGRLEEHLSAAGALAPTVVAAAERQQLMFDGRKTDWQRFQVRVMAGQLVDLRIIATEWKSAEDAIGLLEDLHYGDLSGERSGWDYSVDGAVPPIDPGTAYPFHQIVLMPDSQPEPSWETTQRLIYRADLDAIEEQSSIGHPTEINRRPGQLAAVGSLGSVLWSVQNYIESSAIVSSALTVAALECIRTVRLEAISRYQAREPLAQGSNQSALTIAELEAELTFGAEAASSILPLLQSLRVDGYHTTLFDAAKVLPQAEQVARMLDRVKAAI